MREPTTAPAAIHGSFFVWLQKLLLFQIITLNGKTLTSAFMNELEKKVPF
jgi:hypothetical protein